MAVYSVQPGSGITVSNNYSNPVVGLSSTPSFTSMTLTGTGTALNVPNGDISTSRGNSTGVIYLGNTGSHYLYYDGSNYTLGGTGGLYFSGTLVTGSSSYGSTGATINGGLTATTGIFSSNITTVGNPQFSGLTSYGATFIPSNDGNAYYIRGLNAAANANIWGINANGQANFVGIAVGGALTTATTGTFSSKVIIGAASAVGVVAPVSLDIQGADTFSASGVSNGTVSVMSTSAAAIDKGVTITLGGNTGNGAAQYSFAAIRAAKQSAGADGNYGGYLDFYTMADNGAGVKALHIDKTGAATYNSTVTATNFIATSGAILLSYSGAAAGTGYYYDGSNAAIRTAGSIYFQGANGTGTANIAQVGSIAMSGALTGATYITAANAINAGGSTLGATYGSGFAVGAAGSDTGYGLIIGSTVAGTYRVTNIATASTANVAGVNGDRLMVSQVGVGSYMAINTNGDMGVAGSYYAVSKRASKENIRPISFDSVEAIKNVNIYHYRYKTDQEDANERLGFIADEVPSELSDGKSHDLVHINAVLLDAVKKLTLRIEELEAKNA